MTYDTVFLFDVDNTLLDNDRVQADLDVHIRVEHGTAARNRYWEIFEELRSELGYADYLGALDRYRREDMHDPRILRFVNWLADYPFTDRLYPGALDAPVPAHLRDWWSADLWSLHSAKWWQRHWQRTGIVDVRIADTLKDGWKYWLDWVRLIAPDNRLEAQALTADSGTYLGYVRIVGRRRTDAQLPPPILSVPTRYRKRALLRSSGKY